MNKKTRQEKMVETKKFIAAKHASQTILVDDNWRMVRLDERCWQIQYLQPTPEHPEGVWQERGFYGHVSGCVLALLDKMLDEEAKTSIKSLYDSVEGIRKKLEREFEPVVRK